MSWLRLGVDVVTSLARLLDCASDVMMNCTEILVENVMLLCDTVDGKRSRRSLLRKIVVEKKLDVFLVLGGIGSFGLFLYGKERQGPRRTTWAKASDRE